MTMTLSFWTIGILAASMSAVAIAGPPLKLKHGTYVSTAEQCKEASNANILFWDGIGFSGAHSSKCSSAVTQQAGTRFEVATTCSALGDGSANPSGHDSNDSFSLHRLSATRFEILKPKQPKRTYRWCSVQDPGP